jgi:hypothetical protein
MAKSKMASPAVFLGNSSSSAVSISIVGVPSAQGAIVNYITLPLNMPKTFGNHIYVWQTTDNIVPWNKTPDGDTPVPTDSSTSTVLAKFPFEDKGYIVGYGVAPTPNAVCSTIYMPAGKQNDPTSWVYASLATQVVYVGTNLVQVKYDGLPLYTPATNKNWLGLWAGAYVPYSGDPIKAVNITQDAPPSGYTVIDGVSLLIGFSYVVGYFMVEPKTGRTSLAAASSFTVGSHQP